MRDELLTFFLKRGTPYVGGQPGVLLKPDNQTILCHTMELPWDGNMPSVSCIPVGLYRCQRHNSLDHPRTWQLMDVPGRTGILIHNGNTVEDSLGCIIVGMTAGELDGEPAVLSSVPALDMLRGVLPDNFFLQIS